MADVNSEATLESTPTWAVATVCFILSVISILIDHLLHLLAKHFKKKRKKSLIGALEKIKSDPRRFQLTHQTSFGKRHLNNYWSDNPLLFWPVCLLRQFFKSVSKVDYFTLRHGFIMAHFAEGSNFDFQKYIKRALEKDFGVVMGISWWIWIFSALHIFFNANVFYSHFWLPFIPLMVLLLVGTKLQSIITEMCLDSHDKTHVVRGTLLVRPSDHFFWFGWPNLLLHLISFILFQNSFQLAFFTWTWIRFGIRSCFHQTTENIVIRIALGVLVQILCGYVTLPLYALVTQMGSSMSKVVFTENVIQGVKIWQAKAKKNMALRNPYSESSTLDTSPSFSFDASVSILVDRPLDAKHMAVNVVDEEEISEQQESENQDRKSGSFHGFNQQNRGKPEQF
ncbi:Mlo-related protein [Sesbania bispinosa]|nr:Mlo-related protein [Sesbania bispinosa]